VTTATALVSFGHSPPLAAGAGDERRPSPDALSGPLPSERAGSTIRALQQSRRAAAPLELAELSLSPGVVGDARTLLQAIRALARMTTNDEARRALLRHLRTPSTGELADLRRLARATAAQALAHSKEPDSIRALVLLASGPDATDPELAELAQDALIAHPPHAELLAHALPWLEPAARVERLRFIEENRAPSASRRADQCRKAQRELRRVRDWTPAVGAALLSELADCPTGLSPSEREWTELATKNLTWALRGRAAQYPPNDDPEWRARAEAALESQSAVERSAAAWFLAVTVSGAAERLSEDARPEVRAAASNQRAASAMSEQGHAACTLPPSASTFRIFERFSHDASAEDRQTLACLARRLRPAAGPGLTAPEFETLFLASPAATRLVAAEGLAHASPAGKQLALGVSQRLYEEEADDYVRRFLCIALGDLGLGPEHPLSFTLRLDPDPVCRAVGSGTSFVPRGKRSVMATTTSQGYLALRTRAAPVSLAPAPDGFVGAVVTREAQEGPEHFLDCREPGAPTWACGAVEQKPR